MKVVVNVPKAIGEDAIFELTVSVSATRLHQHDPSERGTRSLEGERKKKKGDAPVSSTGLGKVIRDVAHALKASCKDDVL